MALPGSVVLVSFVRGNTDGVIVQVRARYVDGDTPVGQLSSVVSTATQPEG